MMKLYDSKSAAMRRRNIDGGWVVADHDKWWWTDEEHEAIDLALHLVGWDRDHARKVIRHDRLTKDRAPAVTKKVAARLMVVESLYT